MLLAEDPLKELSRQHWSRGLAPSSLVVRNISAVLIRMIVSFNFESLKQFVVVRVYLDLSSRFHDLLIDRAFGCEFDPLRDFLHKVFLDLDGFHNEAVEVLIVELYFAEIELAVVDVP
ncbi:uncharacterized protein BcabD6B2_14220 [Babesia caballi]|uniref:Uncharacterized protein n=1 Tax=Babesia caballi TaxID=5871 RepID=A0AAV4LNZ9_BABCB|nr:hypothetical protein, conserved [Babesia caballi]